MSGGVIRIDQSEPVMLECLMREMALLNDRALNDFINDYNVLCEHQMAVRLVITEVGITAELTEEAVELAAFHGVVQVPEIPGVK